jgi:hypothetical protein
VPFVQGHIRNEYISGVIETVCAHCGRSLHITVDSELHVGVSETGAVPLVFQPDVDFKALRAPNIIDTY